MGEGRAASSKAVCLVSLPQSLRKIRHTHVPTFIHSHRQHTHSALVFTRTKKSTQSGTNSNRRSETTLSISCSSTPAGLGLGFRWAERAGSWSRGSSSNCEVPDQTTMIVVRRCSGLTGSCRQPSSARCSAALAGGVGGGTESCDPRTSGPGSTAAATEICLCVVM